MLKLSDNNILPKRLFLYSKLYDKVYGTSLRKRGKTKISIKLRMGLLKLKTYFQISTVSL